MNRFSFLVIISLFLPMLGRLSVASLAESLPLSEVSDSIIVSSDRTDYVMSHFWDSMDFTDSLLTRNNKFMEQNFLNFINLMPYANVVNLQDLVDKFLDKANVDEETYSIVYDLAGKYLNNSDSPMRDEEYYIMFLNHAVKYGKLGEADRERAKFRLEMALKNRIGTLAADFNVITRDGEKYKLYKLLTEGYNILIFYDPDCNHCEEVLNRIEEAPILDRANVIAIDTEEDKELWEATCWNLPANWTVGFSLDPVQDEEIYVLPEMPTIYLIDGNGKILLKEATILKIIEVVSAADSVLR